MRLGRPLSLKILPSLLSILLIGMFTITTISLIWPNLVKFSDGQKENPYTNTNPNYTNDLIKWHSVNASGVSTLIMSAILNSTMPPQKQHQEQTQLSTERNTTTSSNNSAITKALHSKNNSNHISPSITNKNKNENDNNGSSGSGSSSSNVTSSGVRSNLTQTASPYHHNNNNSTKSISISIQSSQNIVNGKGTSTVRAVANDAATGKKIENAIVKLNIILTSNGTSKEIIGHNGEATYSIELKPNSKSNSNISFKATAEASAPSYNSTSKATTSSYSTSTFTSTVTSNSSNQKSIINSSNTANFHNQY